MADNRIESLAALISAGDIVKDVHLTEAVNMAKRMTMPLERSLLMLGHANDASLERVLQLQDMIDAGKITLDIGVNALQIEVREYGMTFERALEMAKAIAVQNKPKAVVAGPLSHLMLEAGIINKEQQRAAAIQSQTTGTPEGCLLRLNRQVSNSSVAAAVTAQLMVQNNQLKREEALNALKFAHNNNVSLEQALFEKQITLPGAQDFKASDLFTMSGVITDSDRVECLEERIVNRRPFGDILVQKSLTTKSVVDAAMQLQNMVVKGKLWPYQAAEALRRIGLDNVPLNQALSELPRPAPGKHSLRFGELLEKVGISTVEAVDKIAGDEQHNINIGKKLLAAGVITEKCLFSTLRCQSLLRYGYLSEEQAVAILKQTQQSNVAMDQAVLSVVRYAPATAQWSWV
jgi:hypothetical protein